MAAQESLERVGRGGAGNFWSKKDLEQAAQQQKDLEANIMKTPTLGESERSPPSEYARTGRGGAGNFVASSALSDESKELAKMSKDGVNTTQKTAATPRAPKPTNFGGRGGAGNYRHQITKAEEEEKAKERERLQREMNERIQADVDSFLTPPPRAYAIPENTVQ